MSKVLFEALPPVKGVGVGRKSTGVWSGHAEEAAELRDHPGEWGVVISGLKMHSASRIASAITKGTAKDFPTTVDGYFKAATRGGEPTSDGSEPLYRVFATYIANADVSSEGVQGELDYDEAPKVSFRA